MVYSPGEDVVSLPGGGVVSSPGEGVVSSPGEGVVLRTPVGRWSVIHSTCKGVWSSCYATCKDCPISLPSMSSARVFLLMSRSTPMRVAHVTGLLPSP